MIQSPGEIFLDIGQIFGLNHSIAIRYYGLMTFLGFIVALSILYKGLKNKVSSKELIFDWALITFICGLIGARLWFVILQWDYFFAHPSEIIAIWKGGQSIQGGFIGGALGSYIYYLLHKDKLPHWLIAADIAAIALPLGQAIGRWGNFFNTEAFGLPSRLPWSIYVPIDKRPVEFYAYDTFHPTFLYESILLICIVLIITNIQSRLRLKAGSYFFLYLILYSIMRFFLEFQRLDQLLILGLPAAQIICFLTILISGIFLYKINRR